MKTTNIDSTPDAIDMLLSQARLIEAESQENQKTPRGLVNLPILGPGVVSGPVGGRGRGRGSRVEPTYINSSVLPGAVGRGFMPASVGGRGFMPASVGGSAAGRGFVGAGPAWFYAWKCCRSLRWSQWTHVSCG